MMIGDYLLKIDILWIQAIAEDTKMSLAETSELAL